MPFVGFVRAVPGWFEDPLDLIVGFSILILLALVAGRAIIGKSLLGWAFAGFAIVGILLTEQVWRRYFDAGRAVAPAITAFVLLVLSATKPANRDLIAPPDESAV
jgi:hypothetical protein